MNSNRFVTRSARALLPRTIRNWLRAPRTTIRYLGNRIAFDLGAYKYAQITSDWSVRCHPAAEPLFKVFHNDFAQSQELASFRAHIRPSMSFLDIGAHYGIFALAAARFAPGATITCVEPSPKAIDVLAANLKANELESVVQIIQAAAGPNDGTLKVLSTGPAGADYFVVPSFARGDTIQVPMLSLSSLFARMKRPPTHVKIDIEGYELEVTDAAKETLATLKPIVFLELHGSLINARGKDPASVLTSLRDAGYGSFTLNEIPLCDEILNQNNFNCRIVCQQ